MSIVDIGLKYPNRQLDKDVSKLKQDIKNIETNIDDIAAFTEENIVRLEKEIQAGSGNVTGLIARIDANEKNIATLTTRANINENNINDNKTTIADNKRELVRLGTLINNNTASITATNNRVDVNEADIADLNTRVDTHQRDITAINTVNTNQDARITALEQGSGGGNFQQQIDALNASQQAQDAKIAQLEQDIITKINLYKSYLTTPIEQIGQTNQRYGDVITDNGLTKVNFNLPKANAFINTLGPINWENNRGNKRVSWNANEFSRYEINGTILSIWLPPKNVSISEWNNTSNLGILEWIKGWGLK